MKSITQDEFKAFFNSRIEPELKLLNDRRKKAKFYNNLTVISASVFLLQGLLFILGGFGVFGSTNFGTTFIIIYVAVFAVAILIFALFNNKSDRLIAGYEAEHKHKVLGPLLTYYDKSILYAPDDFLNEEFLIRSGFFDQKAINPDGQKVYIGEDLVEGKIGSTPFAFSDLDFHFVEYYDGKERKYRIFEGQFFVFDFNKEFNGSVFLMPDSLERTFGEAGRKLQKGSPLGKLIRMENPEFEKYFAVYTNDDQLARYILTPSLMERLVNYRKQHNYSLEISFKDSLMFMAIPLKDSFKTSLDKSITWESSLDYLSELKLCTSVVGELNLNTRIWTKTDSDTIFDDQS